MGGGQKKTKPWYKLRRVPGHPYAGRRGVKGGGKGWTVPVHRLTAEARLNGLELEEFVHAIKAGCTAFTFLDPEEWVVHHKDEDPHNNNPENLEVLTPEEHRSTHQDIALRNIATRLVPARVESIEYAGERETYDLEVEGAAAFMASGVAVHNSGKTCVGFAVAAAVQVPTVVIVWSSNLLTQWQDRCESELGIPRSEQGIIRGGKVRLAPVTIAMQQTLASILEDPGSIRALGVTGYFGCLIADEVQRASANTHFQVIDAFPARYRIGISADHRRKDRKEFLTYDLFGGVAADIPRQGLIDQGHVLDVEVRVIPTDFRAPWYAAKQDFNRLLDEMRHDEARNKLALGHALAEVRRGEQVLVISHRVEHCYELDRALTEAGVASGTMVGGENNAEVFERTRQRMMSGEARAAVGTVQAIGQGLDIPSMSRVVVTTPIASNEQQFQQVRGRVCRKSDATGKTDAAVVYLWDRYVYGPHPLEMLARWNNRVVVLDGDQWVEARAYLAQQRRRPRHEVRDDEETIGSGAAEDSTGTE